MTDKVKMTKGANVANVIPEQVDRWIAQGWKPEKPKAKKKTEDQKGADE